MAALHASLESTMPHEPNRAELLRYHGALQRRQRRREEPISLADGNGLAHTDMSYSATVAFLNVLHAIKVPVRDRRPLGNTEFLDMCAAYAPCRMT